MTTQHGFVRGLDSVSESSVREGRFGRMFRNLDAAFFPEKALIALGQTMISGEFAEKFKDRKKADNALGEKDDEENLHIPAGYTYFGQFIDHDITFDPTSSLDRDNDPDALHNFRTPRLDLDSMYGTGPDDQPFLYSDDGMHLLLGDDISSDGKPRPDLPRNNSIRARALTGDKRNDENKIISQLHVLFLRFHNAVLDREFAKRKDDLEAVKGNRKETAQIKSEIFAETQRLVRWHYQWIVIHEYLPRVCGKKAVSDIMKGEDGSPDLKFFKPKSDLGYLPVEFSGACFRFGHSMVRPSYHLNQFLIGKSPVPNPQETAHGKLEFNRIPIFSLVGGSGKKNLANLNSFDALPDKWGIDWAFFFDGLGNGKNLPQHSYKIDSSLVDPLELLPDHSGQPKERQSLANLNLIRGMRLGLPSGQSIAKRMGLVPLTDRKLFDKEGGGDNADQRKTLLANRANGFVGKAPLWYYILREAEVLSDSAHLGPVGGRIVAEVLIGLVAHDRKSYLMVEPNWQPEFGITKGKFTMADLVKIVEA